jgi:hypothetical protein
MTSAYQAIRTLSGVRFRTTTRDDDDVQQINQSPGTVNSAIVTAGDILAKNVGAAQSGQR